MTGYHKHRTLFKQTRHKVFFVALSFFILQTVIYYFSKFIVENYTSVIEVSSHNNRIPLNYVGGRGADIFGKSNYVIYYDVNSTRNTVNSQQDVGFRAEALQFGLDKGLQEELQNSKSTYGKRYLGIKNTTVADVLFLEPPAYLRNFKNPCFLTNTVAHDRSIQCLPYFFVAGFTKCGTTDLHARLTRHPFVTSGLSKEPHWWDDLYKRNDTLQKYIDFFNYAADVVTAYRVVNLQTQQSFHPAVIGDFTPRTVWHGTGWQTDFLNANKSEPRALVPHKIKHLIPMAKIIVLIRNPTERLYSDYIDLTIRHNSKDRPPNPEHFHTLVIAAIHWWQHCTLTLSVKACAYGYPSNMAPLDEQLGLHWAKNAADRLRIGLYWVYLREWEHVFKLENLLIVPLELYSKDPLNYLEQHVFPFLQLVPLHKTGKAAILKLDPVNTKHVRLDPKLDLPMWNVTRDILDQFYRKYNLKLRQYLNVLPEWIK